MIKVKKVVRPGNPYDYVLVNEGEELPGDKPYKEEVERKPASKPKPATKKVD